MQESGTRLFGLGRAGFWVCKMMIVESVGDVSSSSGWWRLGCCVDWELLRLGGVVPPTALGTGFYNTLYTLTFYYKTTVQISFVWKKLNTILKKENKGSLEKSVWKITKSMVKSKGIFVLWPINFCLLQFCSFAVLR